MIEVKLKLSPPAIKETLNRVGIANKMKRILFPSVYLYETVVEGETKYFFIHFKEYFQISRGDNAYNNISDEDLKRLGYITGLLKQWDMIDCDDREIVKELPGVKVLSKSESGTWDIKHKIKF